jgi:hypothetical protein
MNDEITIRKESELMVDLDPTEKALLDDINIVQTPKVVPLKKPYRAPPPVREMPSFDPSMEAFMNPTKRVSFAPPPEEWVQPEEDPASFPQWNPEHDVPMGQPDPIGPQPSEGYSSIEDEKADLLNKLARLEKKGFHTSGKLTTYSDIEQIRTEYKRIMYQIETDQSVKFARRILIACVTGIEFLNKRYDPFDIELEGWSENMMENVSDYDSVFEELHTKYKNKVAIAPEIKLMMMVGGSAMMFHLTKSMFKSVSLNTNEILKQNPDLMKGMMEAIQKTQTEQTPAEPVNTGGRREMRGPGIDLGSLMGGFMPPPAPMNARPVVREEVPQSEDDMSDIVSTTSDTKDVKLKPERKRRQKKKEVTL